MTSILALGVIIPALTMGIHKGIKFLKGKSKEKVQETSLKTNEEPSVPQTPPPPEYPPDAQNSFLPSFDDYNEDIYGYSNLGYLDYLKDSVIQKENIYIRNPKLNSHGEVQETINKQNLNETLINNQLTQNVFGMNASAPLSEVSNSKHINEKQFNRRVKNNFLSINQIKNQKNTFKPTVYTPQQTQINRQMSESDTAQLIRFSKRETGTHNRLYIPDDKMSGSTSNNVLSTQVPSHLIQNVKQNTYQSQSTIAQSKSLPKKQSSYLQPSQIYGTKQYQSVQTHGTNPTKINGKKSKQSKRNYVDSKKKNIKNPNRTKQSKVQSTKKIINIHQNKKNQKDNGNDRRRKNKKNKYKKPTSIHRANKKNYVTGHSGGKKTISKNNKKK